MICFGAENEEKGKIKLFSLTVQDEQHFPSEQSVLKHYFFCQRYYGLAFVCVFIILYFQHFVELFSLFFIIIFSP
jgi:hypothetical protein